MRDNETETKIPKSEIERIFNAFRNADEAEKVRKKRLERPAKRTQKKVTFKPGKFIINF